MNLVNKSKNICADYLKDDDIENDNNNTVFGFDYNIQLKVRRVTPMWEENRGL